VPIPEITVQEAQTLLASPQPPRLIDVREEEEWNFCRIPGAEWLPLSQFGALASSRLTDLHEPLLIYCHHGGRSARVTDALLEQGFTHVTNLAGGVDAWAEEIDPAVPRY
jgi:rhodanese-related sulfurtransferase